MVKARPAAQRWVVTGTRRAGKTTFCRRLADLARSAGWDVAGILSLPRFEGAAKTGIQALDLRSGESRLLASNRPGESEGLRFCGWHFSEAVLGWANGVLRNASPCDLLLVDEIGALELKAGGGLTAAVPALGGGVYLCAVAAVRLELEEDLCAHWPRCSSIRLSVPKDAVGRADAFFGEISRLKRDVRDALPGSGAEEAGGNSRKAADPAD